MFVSYQNIWFWLDINRNAQVNIRGNEVVHTVGVEFEARKPTNVDLISFDTAIQIEKLSNLNVPLNTVTSPLNLTCFTPSQLYSDKT